ncbi:class I tRNA ligase family protein, partial [Patescibacteria group bacterium]|nr:class I tRNA ligase family protein [Patescibacteria group bacterium]
MAMGSKYSHQDVEAGIYQMWEEGGYFTPKVDKKKKPFTIILPLPNANDSMHIGHALFTVEDIMARYHRMLGDPTLWLPGGDHAGIETQFVFEKKLTKEGKSRFDFDRNTLYTMIKEYTEENRDVNKNQMKQLGFSLDWTRYHYSLEPELVEKVIDTFRALHKKGLIYRANRMVNYCTKCGTAFSDLEVDHQEQEDELYYLDYGLLQIATTRPETIFADVAVAVNPHDQQKAKLVGQNARIPLINREIPIIADSLVDLNFGTGALKITPGHDALDFEIGQ